MGSTLAAGAAWDLSHDDLVEALLVTMACSGKLGRRWALASLISPAQAASGSVLATMLLQKSLDMTPKNGNMMRVSPLLRCWMT